MKFAFCQFEQRSASSVPAPAGGVHGASPGNCFLLPGLAVLEQDPALADGVPARRVVRVERDPEQVALEVQRCRRVGFPERRFRAPEPHRAFIADGVRAPRTGPGHRSQARRRMRLADAEAFRQPARPRLVARDLAPVAHRERLTAGRADGLAGLWRESQEGVTERNRPVGQLAWGRFPRQVHGQQDLAEPALAGVRERRAVLPAHVLLGGAAQRGPRNVVPSRRRLCPVERPVMTRRPKGVPGPARRSCALRCRKRFGESTRGQPSGRSHRCTRPKTLR